MATMTTVPVQTHPILFRKRNTLEFLSLGRAVLFALLALLLASILWATGIHRHSMQLVGKDAAPSIISAQRIKSALAAMDADAAEDLLDPGSTHASGDFDKRRVEASDELIEAAKNITFESERAPIETLQISMGNYERLIQQGRDLEDASLQEPDKDKGKESAAMAVRYYRAGAIIMDGTLLPAADDLDKANNDELEKEYLSQSSWSLIARASVLLLGLALLAGLGWMQMFISRRMRRTVNPGLLGATVMALLLTAVAFGAMAREQSDLHAAKEDAFASVHALLQARAVAFSANSEESRYLLDPTHAGEYESEFKANTDALVHMPTALDRYQLLAVLRSGEKPAGFAGLLADELNNITYPGERESAIDSVAKFEEYMRLDKELRSDERAGNQPAAIRLDVDTQPGGSGYAFSQFDEALGRTLDINLGQFDGAVKSGFRALADLEWEAAIAALLVAVLIFFGFAPRIREYQ